LVNIASQIDDHLKPLSVPSSPHINFDEAVALASFNYVPNVDVYRIISSCPVKTSPLDFIPITIVKSCNDIFSVLLARSANISFAEGVFPETFNAGQLTPILKKPSLSADDPSNYRPIINLSSFGMILEKLLRASFEAISVGRRIMDFYNQRTESFTLRKQP
jgi:hypothetical protein